MHKILIYSNQYWNQLYLILQIVYCIIFFSKVEIDYPQSSFWQDTHGFWDLMGKRYFFPLLLCVLWMYNVFFSLSQSLSPWAQKGKWEQNIGDQNLQQILALNSLRWWKAGDPKTLKGGMKHSRTTSVLKCPAVSLTLFLQRVYSSLASNKSNFILQAEVGGRGWSQKECFPCCSPMPTRTGALNHELNPGLCCKRQ